MTTEASPKPLVLYHANCQDGFCAAWVAHLKMPDAEFIPVSYGEPPPDVAGRDVYILDFSYKRAVLTEMAGAAKSILVLDHHKTAEAELRDFGGKGAWIKCVFDMAKSGAMLAWEHFFPDRPTPWIVDYVQDRDLWTWRLPRSRAINAGLSSYPRTFAKWNEIGGDCLEAAILQELAEEGESILRTIAQQIESILPLARERVFEGHTVLIANTPILQSEVAGKLAEGRPFGAVWFQKADGVIAWSLRSDKAGVDVSEVAKVFGGGGHKHAAGFQTDIVAAMEILVD